MNFGAVDSKYKADDILEAQAHVWKYIFNFINSMSLKCAVELGIPDAIYKYGKPMSLSILAATLFINPEKVQPLGRIMSILVRSGFISENKLVVENNDENEGYVLTKVGELLLRENPLTVTPFLLAMLNQEFTKPWDYLASWFQNGDKTAFQTAHGKTLYEFANNMPEFNEQFNAAMFSDSMLVGTCLFSNSEEGNFGKSLFKGLNSMVDVGGGVGTMTKIIGHACPHLSCICYDLPNVVAGLQGAKNITFVAGDMLKAIPQADVVLLKSVLHNWNDEECVMILKQCKEAILKSNNRGKVIVIDSVLGNKNNDHDAQVFFDLLMMTVTTGKERNEEEWHKLFVDAGFSRYKIASKLGIRSVIEIYP
ncbi:hypothetical protein Nepgr_009122 [Nepenthes gracilis]|uniref:Uncharacterized protein n=1 Tax=Nepenthes gracilis TaxID=150966 RepID=A0AAD3SA82_NEPGR|nr:hypothetical protein Nepgr_009122 [Nepenthes gracilis]